MKRLALLGLLAIPAIAIAGSGGGSEEARKDGASEPRERLICRTENITRTRVRAHRTCLTRAEWDARRESGAREGDDRLQSHTRGD